MKIAHDCLIRAIYRNESALSVNDVINKDVSHHCEFASTKQNVVPFAILLACGLSMEQAMIRFTSGKVFSGLKRPHQKTSVKRSLLCSSLLKGNSYFKYKNFK